MTRKWSEIRGDITPERRARIDAIKADLVAAERRERQTLIERSRHLLFCSGGEFCSLDDCLCECHIYDAGPGQRYLEAFLAECYQRAIDPHETDRITEVWREVTSR
jgi:hypothetical protein